MQLSGYINKITYVTRYATSSFNTPENQLLKLFLHNISASIEALVDEVGTGAITGSLLDLKETSDIALKNSWMRKVDRIDQTSVVIYQRAKRSRNRYYRELVRLQQLFEDALEETKWESILKLLHRGWLEPVKDDDLFELYALMKILDALKNDLSFGEPTSLGLIKQNRRQIATFKRPDGLLASVYFDQSPVELFDASSQYKNILSAYEGFTARSRRPDITVKFQLFNQRERIIFFECKKSEDEKYSRDSVYKALGFFKFVEQLNRSTPQSSNCLS